MKLSKNRVRWWLLTMTVAWAAAALAATPVYAESVRQGAGSGGRNAPQHIGKPSIVLVSLDGFRWNYPDLIETPALDELARRGVRADALIPPFPSLTFSSHYTIATGLTPGQHGIVANRFLDPATGRRYSLREKDKVGDGWWYGGEPIWVRAETQGMVTAAFYFVGTEADVSGVRPTDWRGFDVSVPGETRVDQVLEWLERPEDVRPHLITLYLGHVDRAGHDFGPAAPETIEAIEFVDSLLNRLLRGIEGLDHAEDVGVVVVSDHGMLPYAQDAPRLVIDEVIDMTGVRTAVGGPVLYLYLDDPARAPAIRDAVNAVWEHGRAWLPDETPQTWGVNNNPRFGEVILVAEPGYAVVPAALAESHLPLGSHGWAPEAREMHGVFYAMGPGLPSGQRLPATRSTSVYPLLTRWLGLTQSGDEASSSDEFASLLRPAE